jgi:hypothetical protein
MSLVQAPSSMATRRHDGTVRNIMPCCDLFMSLSCLVKTGENAENTLFASFRVDAVVVMWSSRKNTALGQARPSAFNVSEVVLMP